MNPYYDRTKPHHTPDGFRDPQATLHKVSLATVLKWRWRAWRQGLPPAAKVPTPVVAPADHGHLRARDHDFLDMHLGDVEHALQHAQGIGVKEAALLPFAQE